MTTSWTLAMGRDDFARTALDYAPKSDLSDGEVFFPLDRRPALRALGLLGRSA